MPLTSAQSVYYRRHRDNILKKLSQKRFEIYSNIEQRILLCLDYNEGQKKPHMRTAKSYGLTQKDGTWYLKEKVGIGAQKLIPIGSIEIEGNPDPEPSDENREIIRHKLNRGKGSLKYRIIGHKFLEDFGLRWDDDEEEYVLDEDW